MQDSRYFKTLGLSPGSDSQSIRRQYRKLVLIYHPDKNPSLEAKKKFLEITEAYEILIGKKNVPVGNGINTERKKTQEERIKEAKKRYYEQRKKEEIEQELYYQSLFKGIKWRLIKSSVTLGIILSVLMTIDSFLPNHKTAIEISKYAKDVTSFNDWDYLSVLQTKNGDRYWVSDFETSSLTNYNQFYIFETWLFHEPVKIICSGAYADYIYPVKLTFYSFGPLIIVIFLLPTFTFFYRRKQSFYTVLYYLSLILSPILMLVFIFSNYHWLHILGFGFI
jgi:hypothetical protein